MIKTIIQELSKVYSDRADLILTSKILPDLGQFSLSFTQAGLEAAIAVDTTKLLASLPFNMKESITYLSKD